MGRFGAVATLVAVLTAVALLSAGSGAAAPSRAMTFTEVAGPPSGSGTFTNYTNAGGILGTRINAYQAVQVTCALTGFRVADGDTWWYQIASSPWNNAYYAPADNFYNNGQTSGSLIGTPFVDPAVPICGSTPPSGGGGNTGGGTTGGGTTVSSAQWQVSWPPTKPYTVYLGWKYGLGFSVKNVGNATGTFQISDSDSGCTAPGPVSLPPGGSTVLTFTCSHRWNWIAPWSDSKWDLLHSITGKESDVSFLSNLLDIAGKVRVALHSQKIPKLFTGALEKLDLAATVDDLFATSFEDTRQVLLMNQNKNWRPTFVNNFTYTPSVAGLPTQYGVDIYVPQWKWDEFGSYVHNETGAISFDFAGMVVTLIDQVVGWANPLAKIGLFAAGKVLGRLATVLSNNARQAYITAYDPSTDYATVPTVTFTPTPDLDALPDGPIKDWAIAQSHAADVELARDEATVRYAGAVDAGDTDAQALQLNAIQQLTAQEQDLLAQDPDGLQQLLSALPVSFGTEDQQKLAAMLASPDFAGTPAGQALVDGGQSADDVNDLAAQLNSILVPGDPVDVQQSVGDAFGELNAMVQESALTTGLQLDGLAANLGEPVALVSLDKTPGDDGVFAGPVTATLSASPDAAPADRLEYSLDGGTFSPYTAPVVVSTPGRHILEARAVSATGTTQDPPTQTPIEIAPQHAPPVAAIVNPFVVVDGLPATITLDGSHSHDLNADPLTYSWTFDDPGGTTTDASSPTVSHTFNHYGVYTAHLTVDNGFYTATADASIDVVDQTPPTITAPADASFPAGANAQDQVAAWLASATAHDDDPSGTVAVTNDFVGLPPVGKPLTVTWTATDAAGNTATASASLTITDSTPPVIEPKLVGTLGANGWYTGDVQVGWNVSDPESAVSSQTGCDDTSITTDTDGAGVAVTCSATSDGGTNTQTVHVKRDATPPTIDAARSPEPNAEGWNNSDVTVTFTCADGGSGMAQCSGPAVLREGTDQSATGVAVDVAGNTATTTLSHVNVDETAPSLVGTPTTPPLPSGWYSGDVTVHWTCSDSGGSGIDGDCPPDSTITGEGADLSATAQVADRAGNDTAATSPSVKIDRTPPQTTISAPASWSRDDVTATFSASDGLSGVAGTHFSVDGGPEALGTSVTITDEGRHVVEYWSTDNAGNVEAHHTATILIDKTAPTISATQSPSANAAGWNNTDVGISFACSDALSGIAVCPASRLVTVEGRGMTVSGEASDNAGNTATATAAVSIDKTPPTVTASADRAPNASGWYNADVVVSFACADALSGISACPAAQTLKEGADQSAHGSASDAADNTATATLGPIDVDETPPVVTYSGNASVYTVDQSLSIVCAATDALSGVATTSCADITGPAWTFGLGTTSRSASATDRAGNTATGSVSFIVQVTCASLETLIGRFSTSAGVTSGLDAKIEAICAAPDANAKSGKLGAFDNQLAAQAGKALTPAQADTLARLAAGL